MTESAGSGLVLDDFQRQAVEYLDSGLSVLVSAPTGSGKTLVAEHAIDRALAAGLRAFYTTPIKALSNQKYRDLMQRLGPGRVGLLTGDNSIDEHADAVVMTTEILRNMIYAGDECERLGVVVLDEVHYLADAYRGAVWEEVILHLPASVTLVCLSATVSNHSELGGWLDRVHGSVAVISESERPVPLSNLYAVGQRRKKELHLLDTLVDGRPNAEARRFDAALAIPRGGASRHSGKRRGSGRRGQRPGGRRHGRSSGSGSGYRHGLPWCSPRQVDLLAQLAERDLLPVIWFVFSRKGCDRAAARLASRKVRYADDSNAPRIDELVETGLAGLSQSDRVALGVENWVSMLRQGIAVHHAGLVPAFKEVVERCFIEGLVKVVFATETLALGVNMPARSVVLEKLTKYDGSRNAPLSAAQYTQFTGRAGRRGIDEAGYALVLWSPYSSFGEAAELASSRSFCLQSAFQPTYNMVIGLLQRMSPDQARALIRRSFAQYQADAEHTPRRGANAGSQPSKASPISRDYSLVRRFDAVASLLRERGHLRGWALTHSGELLAGIYHEADLALAEALSSGLIDGLAPAEVASVLSAFTYEHRSPGPPPRVRIPSAVAYRRLDRIKRQVVSLNRAERRHRVPLTRQLDTGFAAVVHDWATGMPFDKLMSGHSGSRSAVISSAGEFVRNVKVIADLARRISLVSTEQSTASAAIQAAESLNRGIVALSGVARPVEGSEDALSDGARTEVARTGSMRSTSPAAGSGEGLLAGD